MMNMNKDMEMNMQPYHGGVGYSINQAKRVLDDLIATDYNDLDVILFYASAAFYAGCKNESVDCPFDDDFSINMTNEILRTKDKIHMIQSILAYAFSCGLWA